MPRLDLHRIIFAAAASLTVAAPLQAQTSPQPVVLVSGGSGIEVFDLQLNPTLSLGGFSGVMKIVSSVDGKTAFAMNVSGRSITPVNIANLSLLASVALPCYPNDVAASPDGLNLYVACDPYLVVIDAVKAANGNGTSSIIRKDYNFYGGTLYTVGVSPDMTTLLVGISPYSGTSGLVLDYSAPDYPTKGTQSLRKSFNISVRYLSYVRFRANSTMAFIGNRTSAVGVSLPSDQQSFQATFPNPYGTSGPIFDFEARADRLLFYGAAYGPALLDEFDAQSLALTHAYTVVGPNDPPPYYFSSRAVASDPSSSSIYVGMQGQYPYTNEVRQFNLAQQTVTAEAPAAVGAVSITALATVYPSTAVVIDRTPPTVTSFWPRNLATDVPVSTHVLVNFSKPMAQSSLPGAFTMKRHADGQLVQGTVITSTQALTFAPAQPLAQGTTYDVTIGAPATDLAGNALIPSSFTFTSAIPPVVAVSWPPLGGIVRGSTVPFILAKYTDDDAIDPTAVHLLVDGVDVTPSAQVWPSSAVYTPTAPVASGSHVADVFVADVSGNPAHASSTFTVDATPPAAIDDLAAMTGGVEGAVGLSWSAVGDNGMSGTADHYLVKYASRPIASLADFLNASTFSQTMVPQAPGTRESLTMTGLPSGQLVFVAVAAFDAVGNESPYSNVASTTAQRDVTPPTVISVKPAAGALDVPILSPVVVTFSEPMYQPSLLGALRLSRDNPFTDVAGTVTTTATSLTFTPSSPLVGGALYDVAVNASAVDLAGNPLVPVVLSFTAAIPPTVTMSKPVPGSVIGPMAGTLVAATYSDDVAVATGAVRLLMDGLDVSSSAVIGQTTLAYGPSQPLAGGHHVVDLFVPDLAGNTTHASSTFTVDATPPAAVTDLAATSGRTEGGVTLTWSAVGDDGLQGSASSYLVKLATKPIQSLADFLLASTVTQPVPSLPSGSREELDLTGLPPGETVYAAVAAFDAAGNESPYSNVASTTVQVDVTPPGPITDLAVVAASSHSLTLSWTAPGDDGYVGTAVRYDLRGWSNGPIVTDAQFQSASVPAGFSVVPQVSGTRQSFTLDGLPSNATFNFSIKTIDDRGNVSLLSDPASGTVTGPPSSLAADSIPSFVDAGGTAVLAVKVLDASQRAIAGVPVTFSLTQGTAQLSPASVETDAAGRASTTFTAPPTGEFDTFQAQSGALSLQAHLIVTQTPVISLEHFPTTPAIVVSSPQTPSTTTLSAQWVTLDPQYGVPSPGGEGAIGSSGDRSIGAWVPQTASIPLSASMASVQSGGRLYLFQFDPANPLSVVVASQLADRSLQFTPTAPLPFPLGGKAALAAAGANIYVVAGDGRVAVGALSNSNGAITSWSQAASVPFAAPRTNFGVAVTPPTSSSPSPTLWVIGGKTTAAGQSAVVLSDVYYASLVSGSPSLWRTATGIPSPREGFAVVATPQNPAGTNLADFLYVMGGRDGGGHDQSTVYVSPPLNGQWAGAWGETSSLPFAMSDVSVLNTGPICNGCSNVLTVLGGSRPPFAAIPSQADGTIPAGDPSGPFGLGATQSEAAWTSLTPVSSPTASAQALGGTIYSFSGAGTPTVNRIDALTYTSNRTETILSAWRPVASSPPDALARQDYGAVAVSVPGAKLLFMIGGVDSFGNTSNAVYMARLSIEDDTLPSLLSWQRAADLPAARVAPAVVASQGRIYVLGGSATPLASPTPTATVYAASVADNFGSWQPVGSLAEAGYGMGATVIADSMYVIGGKANSTQARDAFRAPINGDGSVGTFAPMASLSMPPSMSVVEALEPAVAVAGRSIYVAARYQFATGAADQLLVGTPDSNGMVNSWRSPGGSFNGFDGAFRAMLGVGDRLYAFRSPSSTIDGSRCLTEIQLDDKGNVSAMRCAGDDVPMSGGHVLLKDDQVVVVGADNSGAPAPQGLAARVQLGGTDALAFTSAGMLKADPVTFSLLRTDLGLGLGLKYYLTVRSQNAIGVWSERGAGNGVLVLPSQALPDILPPRTTLVPGDPKIEPPLRPVIISGRTPLILTAVDDRRAVGDGLGAGARSVDLRVDGSSVPATLGVPFTLPAGGLHTLTYFSTDLYGNVESPRTAQVFVDTVAPRSAILSPPTGVTLGFSSGTVVGRSSDVVAGIASVFVSIDGGATFSSATVIGYAPDGSALWQYSAQFPRVPNPTLAFYAVDGLQNAESAQVATFTLDTTPPRTSALNLADGQILQGSTFTLQGVSADDASGVAAVQVSTDGGADYSTATILGTDSSGVTAWQFTIALPVVTTTTVIRARAVDGMGNVEGPAPGAAVLIRNHVSPYLLATSDPVIAKPGDSVKLAAYVTDQFGDALPGVAVDFTGKPQFGDTSPFHLMGAVTGDVGVASGVFTLPGKQVTNSEVDLAAACSFRDAAAAIPSIAGISGHVSQLACGYQVQISCGFGCVYSYGPPYNVDLLFTTIQDLAIGYGVFQTQTDFNNFVAQLNQAATQAIQTTANRLIDMRQGLMTVEARTQARQGPPAYDVGFSSFSILVIPHPFDLSGLQTKDNGDAPNTVTLGDDGSKLSRGNALGDVPRVQELISFATSRRQVRVTNTQLYGEDSFLGGFFHNVGNTGNGMWHAFRADPVGFVANAAIGYAMASMPLSYVVAMTGTSIVAQALNLPDPMMGLGGGQGRAGRSIDLNLPSALIQGYTGIPGLQLGADLTVGEGGKLKLGYRAGVGYSDGLGKSFSLGYNSNSGFSFNAMDDALAASFSGGGWGLQTNLYGLQQNQAIGKVNSWLGLNSATFGLLSGDWNGRVKVDQKGVERSFGSLIESQFRGWGGPKLDRYSPGLFGNLFSGWSWLQKGVPAVTRGSGVRFDWPTSSLDLGPGISNVPRFGGLPHVPPNPMTNVPAPDVPGSQGAMACSASHPGPNSAPIGGGFGVASLRGPVSNQSEMTNAFSMIQKSDGQDRTLFAFSGMTPGPIDTATGDMIYQVEDLLLSGRSLFVQMLRTYNSISPADGPFGFGWSFNYGMRVERVLTSSGTLQQATVVWGDGSRRAFLPQADGSFVSPTATASRLASQAGGGYVLTQAHGTQYRFDANGRLTVIADKNANRIALSYQNNALTGLTDPAGRTFSVAADGQGRILSITDPGGRTHSYAYDSQGNLVKATGPGGYQASYGYDAAHHLTSYSDPHAQTGFPAGSFSYDAFGRAVAERDAAGTTVASLAYALTPSGLTSVVTDALGRNTADVYDPNGFWTAHTAGDGATTRLTFDSSLNLTQVVEPDNSTLATAYDARGNRLSFTDAAGNIKRFSYDPVFNELTAESLPNGGSTLYGYDSNGNLTSITDPVGGVTKFSHGAGGALTGVTDARGLTAAMTRDAYGDLLSVTDPGGGARSYVYDALGRLTATTDEEGSTLQFAWGTDDALTQLAYPGGETYAMAWDPRGNLLSETNERGATVRYDYDANGRMRHIIDASGGTYVFDRDAAGNMVKATDPLGEAMTVQYDGVNRVVKNTDPEGHGTSVGYDAAGRVTTLTDPNGGVTRFARDANGRVTQVAEPDGSVVAMGYDAMGNVTQQTDPRGGVKRYSYDASGELLQATDAQGGTYGFARDADGNLTTFTDPNGHPTTMQYDANGRMTSLTTLAGGQPRTTSFTLDKTGRMTAITGPLGQKTLFGYHWDGQVAAVTRPDGTTVSAAYDPAGDIQSLTDPNGSVYAYQYDALNELVSETNPAGEVVAHAYDAVGRETKVTLPDGTFFSIQYGAAEEVQSVTDPLGKTRTYGYDPVGNLTSETDPDGNHWAYGYDANGRVTGITSPAGQTQTYSYDGNNNIVKAAGPNGGVDTYQYNGLNFLTRAVDALGQAKTFVYDGVGNLLSRTDALGAVTRWSYDESNENVSVTDALGQATGLAYDADGQLTTLTTPRGAVTHYSYDTANRLASITDPDGGVTKLEYDRKGNTTALVDPLGARVSYAYDARDYLASKADPTGTETYGYDSLGRLVKRTDVQGGVTAYVYDADNRLTSRTDPTGAVTGFAYDANGNRTALTDPAGKTTTYTFDPVNRLTATVLPDGETTRLEYDGDSNLSAVVDPQGGRTALAYDALNRQTRTTDPAGAVTAYGYDADGSQTSVTDALGKVTSSAYDLVGRLVKTVDPSGGVTAYAYDTDGNQTSVTDPSGAVSRYEYDPMGRETASVDPQGARTTFVYDASGRLTAITDPLGRRTANVYDASGRLTQATDALGRATLYQYDARGDQTAVTDPSGRVTGFSYDSAGRLLATISPLGARTAMTYDARGLKVSETDADGRVTAFQYDADGRLLKTFDPAGGVTTVAYDARGNKTNETAPDGRQTLYAYDASNRLTSRADPGGGVTSYAYDAAGRLSRTTDPNGNATGFAYDQAGRLTQVTDAAGGVWTYSYTPNGLLASIADANGHATLFTYDASGRRQSLTDADGSAWRYSYDAAGELTQLTKPDGGALAYSYDADGRLSGIQGGGQQWTLGRDVNGLLTALAGPGLSMSYAYDADRRLTQSGYGTLGKTLAYGYDAKGNRVSLTRADGTVVGYAYDALDRLTQVQGAGGAYTLAYDPAGRPTRKSFPNGVAGSYAYDAAGRLASLAYAKADGALLARYAYGYDAAGNRTAATDLLGTRSYGYDKLDRLVKAAFPSGREKDYAYDAVGNRLSLVESMPYALAKAKGWDVSGSGPGRRVSATTPYSYDPADRIVSAGARTFTHDANGRLARDDKAPGWSVSYAYDPFDRPSRVSGLRDPVTGAALPDTTVSYAPMTPDLSFTPGPLGVRVSKTDSGGVSQYVVDATGNLLDELGADGTPRARYLYGAGLDEPLAVTDSGGRTLYMLTDGQGSVRMLTDASGDPAQQYEYEPFGEPSARTRELNNLKYTAREHDADSGLQYNRARYLDPSIGRWTTPDPMSVFLKGPVNAASRSMPLHPFVAFANDPISLVDPLGLLNFTKCPTPKAFQQGLSCLNATVAANSTALGFFNRTYNTDLKRLLRGNTDPLVEVRNFPQGLAGRYVAADDPRTILIAQWLLGTHNPRFIAGVLLHELTHYAVHVFNHDKEPYTGKSIPGSGPIGSFNFVAKDEGDVGPAIFFHDTFRELLNADDSK